MFIYEIGTITYYHTRNDMLKAMHWRTELDNWAAMNSIKTFNPVTTFLREMGHTYNPKMCVDQNDYYINKCDIAVANLTDIEHSPGSIYELVRFKELRKPVIAFGERYWSPHINSCISHQCETLDDAIELLSIMFNQGNF